MNESKVHSNRASGEGTQITQGVPEEVLAPVSENGRKSSGEAVSSDGRKWSEFSSESGSKSVKRTRRSREQGTARNYVCGCGKSYLSYPALYTHAKTKHNSVFPPGTVNLDKPIVKSSNSTPEQSENASGLERIYLMNRELQLFLRLIPACLDSKEHPHKQLIEFFPCELFKSESLYNQLLISLDRLRQELAEEYGSHFLKKLDIVIFEINNPKKLNIYEVFGLFLMHMFRFVCREFYSDLVFLAVSYLTFLSESGWLKLGLMIELDKSDFSADFCAGNFAEYLPDFVDEFICGYFCECLCMGRILTPGAQLRFIGAEPNKLYWTLGILRFFCQFLEVNRFSNAKVLLL